MTRTLVAAVVALAVAAPAAAQSRAEWRARALSTFAAADRDRNGELTRGEVTRRIVATGHRGMTTGRSRILTNHWMSRLDNDRSNSVSRREALAGASELFARADVNRDGRIGPRERQAAEALLRNPAR